MDGDVTGLERSQFDLVVVHQNYLVAQVGETRARHQSHVTRTHHCNVHPILRVSTKRNSPPGQMKYCSSFSATKATLQQSKPELMIRPDGQFAGGVVVDHE